MSKNGSKTKQGASSSCVTTRGRPANGEATWWLRKVRGPLVALVRANQEAIGQDGIDLDALQTSVDAYTALEQPCAEASSNSLCFPTRASTTAPMGGRSCW